MLEFWKVESVSNLPGMENVFPMKPERQSEKEPSRGIRRRLPESFVCIAPDEAMHVFEFINGSIQEHEKEIAKLHFCLCLHCQEMVEKLPIFYRNTDFNQE